MLYPSISALYDIFKQHPSITTDTRNIKAGELFFALKGRNFNGNVYAEKALELGAAFAIIDEESHYRPENIVLVKNVLETLQALALHHRRQLKIPVIAITGSNGKTTTKELVHVVLSSTFKTSTTAGNLNNHIGIPLTLLRIPYDAEIAVVEMGANHQKEIEAYCRYTEPTIGLITNCGKAHLEGFGGIDGIIKGKGELFDYLRAEKGTAFICSNFGYFKPMSEGITEIIWYGTTNAYLTGEIAESDPFLNVRITNFLHRPDAKSTTTNPETATPFLIGTQLVGGYNLYNVLAAVAIGQYLNINPDTIKTSIEGYMPTNSRSQLIEKNGNRIVLDAYNANPTSMAAAIENFAKMAGENKIVFIGGMMELGQQSLQEHIGIVKLLERYLWKDVVLVGGDFEKTGHRYHYFENSTLAAAWWKTRESRNNTILVKGSRSMKMELVMA